MSWDGAAYFGGRQSEPKATGIPSPIRQLLVTQACGLRIDRRIHNPQALRWVEKSLWVNCCFIDG